MTCDPNRMEGAHSNRLGEFPAEDVFLEKELIARRDELAALKKERMTFVNEIAALESDLRKLLEFRNQIVHSKFYKVMACWWRFKRRKLSVPVAEMKLTFGDR